MRRLLLAAVAAAALVLVVAPAAQAHGGTRAFSLVVAPASVPAGAQTTLTATLKNRSSYDKLSSADIAGPAGLTGVRSPTRLATPPRPSPGASSRSATRSSPRASR